MNFLKDAKMCAITSAVLCIVLGLLFLLFPAAMWAEQVNTAEGPRPRFLRLEDSDA